MNPLNLVSDTYERQARLYPSLLLLAPAVVMILCFVKLSGTQIIATSFVSCGGAFLLSQLARDLGKRREPSLFFRWGGLPSMAIFRHSDTRLDAVTKARYHRILAANVKGSKAPTPADEEANPTAADQTYTAWSHYLRVNSRDIKKYPLLFQENVNYGYRRNIWGLRPLGIGVCSSTSLFGCTQIALYLSTKQEINITIIGATLFSVLMLVMWIFLFTSEWIRIPADAYSARLVETVESLSGSKSLRSRESDPAKVKSTKKSINKPWRTSPPN